MRKNLVYVGGSKGGTGKSMVCMALVDYFRKAFPKDTLLLVETDTSDPDVGRQLDGSFQPWGPDARNVARSERRKRQSGRDLQGVLGDE